MSFRIRSQVEDDQPVSGIIIKTTPAEKIAEKIVENLPKKYEDSYIYIPNNSKFSYKKEQIVFDEKTSTWKLG